LPRDALVTASWRGVAPVRRFPIWGRRASAARWPLRCALFGAWRTLGFARSLGR